MSSSSSPEALERVSRTTRGVDLADRLRHGILEGALPPGTRLLQPQVAEAFGTSRTPVREALHKLQAWGLVDLSANRAAIVRRPRRDHYAKAFEVWAELGALAVELAAHRPVTAVDRWRAALSDEWSIVEDAASLREASAEADEEWISAQKAFHDGLVDASGSDRLKETVGTVTELFRWEQMWQAVEDRPYRLRSFALRHEEIAVLLRRRDAAAASACMRRHILEMADAFLAWFDLDLDSTDGDDRGE